jgi:beta-glucanase (GH16 family)
MAPNARLVFSDDFVGNRLDTTKWDTCYPWSTGQGGCTNPGNHELEWYRPSAVGVNQGALHLTASRQPVAAERPGGGLEYFEFTSGMVSTAHHFEFTYGYVEFRARVPRGQGLWSALWMLPTDESSTPEIDVVEVIGQAPTTARLTYHAANGAAPQTHAHTADLSQGWHIFAVNWEPGSITWYVDGKAEFHVTKGVSNQPMFLLADLAVGGDEPGPPGVTTQFPASLDIDYVRVWQRG